ncbi:TonB-dependent receptor domain-containing protein [Pseudoalteromonas sp. SSDWG2]|uniref:TonB-dependent receptor domain-containing protein n=1 Tax=Pseudoalteromonas sp. SSDWG2 TaxID=3139391 RepID=UPI003BAB66DA
MLNSKIAKSVRLALAFGAASTAGMSANAIAAEEGAEEVERIEVTGSRIKRADLETAQPVAIIDRASLEATGLTSVGDFLQTLPIAGSAINTTFNNGGDGSTRIDLRNLGSSRVLVLVNGRRWINSGTGADSSVDLNTIPTTVIKRIEVLKDGAGAVYGSDAVAGVVNIITRKDFEGVEATAYMGESSEGDGAQEQYDFTVGTATDKGHVALNVSYTKQEPIWAGDREISNVPQFGTGNRLGSSGTPQGRFSFVDGTSADNYRGFVNHSVTQGFPTDGTVPNTPFNADGSANPDSDFTPFSNNIRYNYAPVNYLLTPQDRWSLYATGGYELADNVRMSTDVLYNHRESAQFLAPMPLFIGPWAGGAEALNPTVISAENIYNPFGFDIFGEEHMSYYNGGFIGRRMIENGGREFSQKVETWKFNLGFDGFINIADVDWDWSVHFGYGDNSSVQTTKGRLNMVRIAQALSADCNTDSSCVPLNLFGGEGSITPEMLDYITTTETSQGGNKLWNYAANISGSPVSLPAGDLGIAAGYEYRREEGYNLPDYLVQSGQSSGGSIQPTEGTFSESSYHLEVIAPLVADAPMMESLELSAAIRYTDIENSVGFESDNTSYSVGLTWRVNDDLMARANSSTGFRAPSISDLFGGLSVTFPSVTDPCNGGACADVPPAYTQPNTQLEAQVGSNDSLEPEESESLSYGIVYEPSFVEGLNLSVDVWDIEIENVITSAGFQQVLDTCSNYAGKDSDDANHPIAPNCDSLLTRAPSGVPVTFINPLLNSGKLETNGVDFDIMYDFETSFGSFKTVLDATYTDVYRLVNDQGVASSNYSGRNLGDAGFPRWKSNFDVTYMLDNFSFNYNLQLIGKQIEDCGISNVSTDTWACSDLDNDENKLGTTVYHDIQASYMLEDMNTRLTFGIKNLFDKVPPISTQAFANSFDASLYDPTGRFFYGRVTVKF